VEGRSIDVIVNTMDHDVVHVYVVLVHALITKRQLTSGCVYGVPRIDQEEGK
jgi:hypothetical protein